MTQTSASNEGTYSSHQERQSQCADFGTKFPLDRLSFSVVESHGEGCYFCQESLNLDSALCSFTALEFSVPLFRFALCLVKELG